MSSVEVTEPLEAAMQLDSSSSSRALLGLVLLCLGGGCEPRRADAGLARGGHETSRYHPVLCTEAGMGATRPVAIEWEGFPIWGAAPFGQRLRGRGSVATLAFLA